MDNFFQFLGTSASAGVPVIGCHCAVCSSPLAENKRLRPSALVRIDGKSLLIDIGPDFRAQALQYKIDQLDGLLLTHTHYDHIAGIDELRIFNVRQKKPFPCLLSQESLDELKKRYYYFFKEGQSTKLDCSVIPSGHGEIVFLGTKMGYCSYLQSTMLVNGFRFGKLAYLTDIQKYEDSIFPFLEGVETLIISALKPEASPFHLSFEQAVAFSRRVGAKETWITHLGHFLDHASLNALLPPDVKVAYDGLRLCMN